MKAITAVTKRSPMAIANQIGRGGSCDSASRADSVTRESAGSILPDSRKSGGEFVDSGIGSGDGLGLGSGDGEGLGKGDGLGEGEGTPAPTTTRPLMSPGWTSHWNT
jgi:hypothetical protein